MKTFFVRTLHTLALGSALLFSIGSLAQEVPATVEAAKPVKDIGTTYTVSPDTRDCAAPLCGGWILKAVNQIAPRVQTEDEAYQTSLLAANTIYVSKIDYKGLGLKPKQVEEFEVNIRSGQALIAGKVVSRPAPGQQRTDVLDAKAVWVSPNKAPAIGPYLKVSSSGIVCVTTPCPYFTVKVVNNTYTVNYDGLIFDRAELDSEQEARAWQAVSGEGLVLAGHRYYPEGETGTGTGISATKVFFSYPTKKPVRP
ncbi:MAG: hypothetical protein EOO52_12415 [Gammaproteobacteria bacterium]|nr:MAG: hypothetical protein EOO52_12415 [Gammaproteobacteria bacterium]